MANIILENISVEFPIYNVNSRSLKKQFISFATGGRIVPSQKNSVIIKALNNISLSLTTNDRVGLVGHNGAGKSTLLKLLAKIYEPTQGFISISGEISPLLNLAHGIEAEFTGYENIMIRGTVLGLSKAEIKEHIQEIAEFSGLGEYMYMPIRTYSSGMLMRLAFAISTCINPDILLIDEAFGAGDKGFMEKAKSRMVNLLNQSNIVVLASHTDFLIKEFCNKALWLEKGEIKFFGEVDETLKVYNERKVN